MRQRLRVAMAVGCLLWTGAGLSVLAVAVHEHSHHVQPHDHHEAVRVALHGHAHEGAPDHDHDVMAPPAASRLAAEVDAPPVSPRDLVLAPPEETGASAGIRSPGTRVHGPPPYLASCVLLT